MKKIVIFLLVLLIVIIITIPLLFIYNSYQKRLSQQVHIYVKSDIYPSITREILQYQTDIFNQGCFPIIFNWSSSNASLLKQNLISAKSGGLIGAVFIGDIPVAQLTLDDPERGLVTFPCDLYFMDLDGKWKDDDNDQIFDSYKHGQGDIQPEIWIGRINPHSLTNINPIVAYKEYFNRNHAYRNGSLSRPHSALLYIDDDWYEWRNEWYDAMTIYSNITMVADKATTNAENYKDELGNIYEFVHVGVHSYYDEHVFYSDGISAGTVDSTDIANLNLKALFYNLYSCSSARFTEENNLGTQYLFSEHTLAVIGSTKVGGMIENRYFYVPLAEGETIGEALRLWFHNPYGARYLYSKGMTILGDPLLRV